jgi:stage III sporulation protein AH
MNTKRQTIWLVSMLSLMVILSAYYLFTEDVDTADMLTDGTHKEQTAQNGATEASGGQAGQNAAEASSGTAGQDGVTVNDVVQSADAGGTKDAAGAASKDDAGISKEDQQVLEDYKASNAAASSFNALQEKRDQKFYDEYNRLMGVTTDPKADPAAASKAVEQLGQLEDKNTKITGLEEELTKQYKNAFVTEENNRYKVVIQSEKLDRSQADSIVTAVIKELGATPDQVTVQYIP